MDKLDFAIQVLVLGFMVVVITLFALYGILLFFSLLFNRDRGHAAIDSISAGKNDADSGDGVSARRTAAVILAAVYQYLLDEKSISRAGIMNIKVQASEIGTENSWRITGRKNILGNRIELENIRRKRQIENI